MRRHDWFDGAKKGMVRQMTTQPLNRKSPRSHTAGGGSRAHVPEEKGNALVARGCDSNFVIRLADTLLLGV